ncbi:unnamed protein product, partial [Polarella glacialis]
EPAGIFARDVLLVPAHDPVTAHWWLAIVFYPWAATSIGGEQQEKVGSKPFVAFLDSLSSRSGGGHPEVQKAAAATAAKRQRQAMSLIRDYLKKEWAESIGDGRDFQAERLQGVSIAVPQQETSTDCGLFVLEFARRLLDDPAALEALAASQLAPPQLLVPIADQFRRRWQHVGDKFTVDATTEQQK